MSIPSTGLHGLMIELASPEHILAAARAVRQAGYRQFDAYTPYTVEGLATELGLRRTVQPSVALIAGLVGAAVGYFMQYYTMVIDYPFNAGGRPVHSWPMFIPITFEVMVLVTSLALFIGFLFATGLPKLNHPVFNEPSFVRASQDGMFLCIEATDPRFDFHRTKKLLESLDPVGEVKLVAQEPHRRAKPSSATQVVEAIPQPEKVRS